MFRIKAFKRHSINGFSVVLAVLYAFPILYMVLTSFKSEASVVPPSFLFHPTLENYKIVIDDRMFLHLRNSLISSAGTVFFSLLLALPASYAIVYAKLKKADAVYFWFISTTLLPAVGVIIPVYLTFTKLGLIDTIWGLILLYTGIGAPLTIWLVTTFFQDIPTDIVEAAYMDGSSPLHTFFKVMLPLMKAGVTSASLLVFITVWNDFLFAQSVTYTKAATLPVYMAAYMTQQGFFWAKMSAASTLVVVIPVILVFFTQKSFVKGMTMGAIKE